MEKLGYIQVRTSEDVKKNAAGILDRLGLNISTYVNMALNQLIIHEGIPFQVTLNPYGYTSQEIINEVAATMRMEGMPLTDEDIQLLQACERGECTTEEARQKILSEV